MNEPATAAAARLYLRDLERAYQKGREVYDPDYALAQDPDVYEIVRRDAVTSHAIEQRKHMVAGSRFRVLPADDEEPNRRAAAIVEKLLQKTEELGDFAMSRFHLADAVFRGSAWAIIEGRKMPLRIGNGKVRAWWVPTRVRPVDKRRFRQFVAADGSVGWEFFSVERKAYEPLGDRRRWFVRLAYDDTEDSLGYGRGLMEPLYHTVYSKAKVRADRLAGIERWAMGIVDVTIDDLRIGSNDAANQQQVDRTIDVLRKMRSRHEFVHGKDVTLEIHESSGVGHEMVSSTEADLATDIRILVLGSNLPTSANSGGSYALAEVQENSTETLVNFDRTIMSNAVTRDVIGLTWRMNAEALREEGLEEAEPPRFAIVSQIRRDAQAASQIGGLVNAGIQNLREDEVFEAVGLTPAGPHDKKLEVAAPVGAGVAEAPKRPAPT